jgi:hypothetical protein
VRMFCADARIGTSRQSGQGGVCGNSRQARHSLFCLSENATSGQDFSRPLAHVPLAPKPGQDLPAAPFLSSPVQSIPSL